MSRIWPAIWEATQNAIIHGSTPGDTIYIELMRSQRNQFLEVMISQPRSWQEGERQIEDIREKIERGEQLHHTRQVVMGGVYVISILADDLQIVDLGHKLIMKFSL